MPKTHSTLRVPPSCRPGSGFLSPRSYTETVEEYISAIYRLRDETKRAATGDIAKYMMVAAGSATAMLKRLTDLGLAQHAAYQGVTLTERGEELALQLTRSHRIIETLLVQEFELPWYDVHELASKLEHYVSEDVINAIDRKLGYPTACPHGNPIGPLDSTGQMRLEEAGAGKKLEIVRITDERPEFLRHIQNLGLKPGATLKVTEKTDVHSLIELDVIGRSTTVGPEVTRNIWVREASQA